MVIIYINMKKETISLQLAVNDQVKTIEEKQLLTKIYIIILIGILLLASIGLTLQAIFLGIIFYAYNYHKDEKEKERLVKKYGL